MGELALIAGAGRLAAEIVAALPERPVVCALDGHLPEALRVDRVFSVETLVPLLERLQSEGVRRLVFAGAVERPKVALSPTEPFVQAPLARLLPALSQGDDAALRAVIALVEEFGFTVEPVQDLVPALVVQEGVLTRPPRAEERTCAARGAQVLAALGRADVGQACIVAGGLVLGIEALYGTDALLADVAQRRPTRHPQEGGVLVKRAKPGQDLRVDLPTIGPETIKGVLAARLTGICLQAGRVFIVDRHATLAAAQAADLALWAEP